MKNEMKKKALKLSMETVKKLGVRSDIKAGAIHSNAIEACSSGGPNQR